MKKLSIFAFCLAALNCFGYNFLFTAHSGGGVVAIGDDSGSVKWSMKAEHPQCAEISADGKRLFFSWRNGAEMFDIEKNRKLWEYKCPEVEWDGEETAKLKKGDKVRLENPVAQILGKDKFLVGNEGRAALLEINSKGRVLREIKGESLKRVNHGEFRLAHFENGKFIFPMLSSSLLAVYNSKGKQIRRIETGSGVVSAVYLDKNNILAGGIFGLAVFDKNNVKTWSFTGEELQQQLGAKEPIVICDVKVMPDKNILCTTYGGKDIPDVLEISMKDKQIVKKIDFPEYTHFSALQLLDDDLKPLAPGAKKRKPAEGKRQKAAKK